MSRRRSQCLGVALDTTWPLETAIAQSRQRWFTGATSTSQEQRANGPGVSFSEVAMTMGAQAGGRTIYVMLTMDCETSLAAVTSHPRAMSSSGPADYQQSEDSIRGYFELAAGRGFPVTLLAHPEVAVANRDLLLDLQGAGACLGLHVHPYKLSGCNYSSDLGAYAAPEQRQLLSDAMRSWKEALGSQPKYFRAGYFSANDATFGVLDDLGFEGGSLSNPGRILPSHQSVWAGAAHYPHRANRSFRQIAGDSRFVEVPVSVATNRPVARGHAGEQGYEWLYIPHTYDHRAIVRDLLMRFASATDPWPVIVTDTHNDQAYADPNHRSTRNFHTIMNAIAEESHALGMQPVGATLGRLCDMVRAATATGKPQDGACGETGSRDSS